ncbi:MAG: type IV pilin protein, partial [Psychromonas sp.]|nr:type IV pilin protein [Psychromonas sp.]
MKKNGFTLIELLIAVAIIGILAGVAYPTYMHYVLTAKRSEAQSTLMDLANRQEMYYLDHHQYAVNLKTELGLSANPFISENGYYSVSSSSAKVTADFTLTATAINTQAADSDCAQLEINQNLERTATSSDCWQ